MPQKRKQIFTSITLALGLAHQPAFAQFNATLELGDLNGSNGFTINGTFAYDNSGNVVSAAGDINGDGIDDVIIGARNASPNGYSYAGSSYVVFGSGNGLPNPLNLSSLDGNNGFALTGEAAYDSAGFSVSAVGDINGDGIDDLIIGAPYAATNGRSYVVFGAVSGFPYSLKLGSLDGTNGFIINGESAGDGLGNSVSDAGDVNGDGIDDLIISAPIADSNDISETGKSYVVFGSNSGFPHPFDLSTLDGSNGFTINGVNEVDRIGRPVRSAGDVNGDGIDDLIIGARYADPNGNNQAGSSYVVFGSNSGFPQPFKLSTLDGTNGVIINGVAEFDSSGDSVSGAGDINGDGIDDLIIGASGADPNGNNRAGSSYVVFGSNNGLAHPFELSTVNGSNGFVINGLVQQDGLGGSVSAAGDVNGDGIDDLIIGASGADPNGYLGAGSSYVVLGSNTALPHPFDLSSLNGENGFVINGIQGGDSSGYSVNTAGDVNGDGVDDLIIGAQNTDINGNNSTGSSYVVFGKTDLIFKDGFE